MTMHAAVVDRSPRLQRVLDVLRDGEASTLDLAIRARVCAVNSIVAELRTNGYDITCTVTHDADGRRWTYRLVSDPDLVNPNPETEELHGP